MSPLKIYHDDRDDVTVVSNLFIDEYMKDANNAQIKVFLYLIRMMGAKKAPSISDIADMFNYPEKDIIRALKFWEKKMLLRVEYDEQKNPVAIHFLNTPKQKPDEVLALSKSIERVPELKAEPVSLYAKPEYSADDLRAFKAAEETPQLLFVVEKYLGKTLSAADIKSIFFFTDVLNFSGDLIDYLVQYCVERGKKDFRYIEKVAINWAEEGISTPKMAARAAHKYDKTVYDVMKALGKNAAPTKGEANYILRWVNDLGFSSDIIHLACERTVMATDSHRFEYCNKILESWRAAGVHNKADITRLDLAFTQKKAAAYPAARSSADRLKFNQFTQNSYDFEALEREIVSN